LTVVAKRVVRWLMDFDFSPLKLLCGKSNVPTIAIIGASADRTKFGNKAVRAYALKGYDVYPINPKVTEIEGHRAYPSLIDAPVERFDRVSLYLPPALGLQVLPQLTAKPVRELWLNPGTESPELLAKATELGLKVVRGCSIVDIGVYPEELG
jgi:predicted CoA-binding protein